MQEELIICLSFPSPHSLHFSFSFMSLSFLSLASSPSLFLPPHFALPPLSSPAFPLPHLPPSPAAFFLLFHPLTSLHLPSFPFPSLLSWPSPPSVVPNDLYSSFSVTNQDTTGATIAVSPISTDLAAPNTAGFLEVQLNEQLHWIMKLKTVKVMVLKQ